MGDQTRLGVTLNIATEWIFCASGGCRRVRCSHDLVLSHQTLEPADLPVRQAALP